MELNPDGTTRPLYNGTSGYFDGAVEYITAAWDEEDVYATPTSRVPEVIVVGRGDQYEADVSSRGTITYTNVPLRSNTQYTIFTRYDIRNDVNPGQVSKVQVFSKLLSCVIF